MEVHTCREKASESFAESSAIFFIAFSDVS